MRSKSFARHLAYAISGTDELQGYEDLRKEQRADAVRIVTIHDGTAAAGFTVTSQCTARRAETLTRYLLDLPGRPLISPVRKTRAGRFTCLVQSSF